ILIHTASGQNDIHIIFNGNNTKLTRFELELSKNLVNRYLLEKKRKQKIVYHGVKEFSNSFDMLNKSDSEYTLLINQVSITTEREEKFDFSRPYMRNYFSLLSRKDFFYKGKQQKLIVGCIKGSIYDQLSSDLSRSYENIEIAYYSSNSVCAKDVQTRKIDLYFADYYEAWVHNLKLFRIINQDIVDNIAIVFKKGSQFRNDIERILISYQESDDYKQLIKRHFGDYATDFFAL
ncbi:MAG: transporter substrate-binding domain-containing protein, partial [Calditrichaeota bacterium]|nr:transporter substrate-binding domain-containing protein [Calditrichota bacterium]